MTALEQAIAYAHTHYAEHLDGFKQLLSIPSISTDPAYAAEVQRAADWIVAEMQRIGLHNCRGIQTAGHPVVYGEWLDAGPDVPTVLVYAHYDVQPVDPLELWDSPPFEPQVRDGKLFARGSIDDKCGVFINLKAVESMLQTAGTLPVNMKFLFEGEEESGSPSMDAFIREHTELLQADLLLISDGGSEEDQPLMFTSLRGIVTAEVNVSGPMRDLHSGLHGGAVHNPVHLVGKIIGALHDDAGRIQIPGFYDAVQPLSPDEVAYLRAHQEAGALALAQKDAGVKQFWGVPEYSFVERITTQPTCDVNGVYGGYAGPGNKTIIPARAGFKVSLRLVADQDPNDIATKFTDFINSFAVPTLDLDVQITSQSWPATALFDAPPVEALQRAFEATWGKRALLYRQGGSVPVVGTMQQELGIEVANLGFGVGENGHAPNEYLILDHFARGIDTALHFYHYLGGSQ